MNAILSCLTLLATPFNDSPTTLAFKWGSVIGPPSYVVAASDLHPRSALNCLMKYADDTYLLVDSNNISTVADEFAHINAWARTNNLQLNPSKTRELVVSRRRLRTGSV